MLSDGVKNTTSCYDWRGRVSCGYEGSRVCIGGLASDGGGYRGIDSEANIMTNALVLEVKPGVSTARRRSGWLRGRQT